MFELARKVIPKKWRPAVCVDFKRFLGLLLLLTAVTSSSGLASFDLGLINVDIDPQFPPTIYTGAAVIGQAGDLWNEVPVFSLSPIALKLADGSASAVTLQMPFYSSGSVTYGLPGFSGGSSPMSLGPFGALMGDGAGSVITSLPVVLTLNGLTPGARYDVFAYSYSGAGAGTVFSAGAVNATVINPAGLNALIEGQSYAKLASVIAGGDGSLGISLRNLTFSSPLAINGFQLQPTVPEANTSLLVALALLVCLLKYPCRGSASRRKRMRE